MTQCNEVISIFHLFSFLCFQGAVSSQSPLACSERTNINNYLDGYLMPNLEPVNLWREKSVEEGDGSSVK